MNGLPFLIDFFVAVLFLSFMLTQVILPLWRGRPLFPFFNRDRRKAVDQLATNYEKRDVEDILEAARRVRKPNKGAKRR